MRFLDLLRMSSSSLWKRKVRSILTVLGVIIGTASIVVMISLGLGLNKSSMENIEQYGGLTTIEVMESGNGGYYGGGMMVAGSANLAEEKKQEIKHLDDKLVEQLKGMEHVEEVYPVLSTSAIAKFGMYENYLNIQGMNLDALENLNIPIEKGSLPTGKDGKLEFLYGNLIMQGFSNSKTGQGFWETGKLPDIDLMNDPMFVIFDTDAYNQIKWGNNAENATPVTPPKKYVIDASGLVAGGEEYNNHSWNVYCEMDSLKKQLKKVFKNKPIPGQPTLPSGKPYKEMYYNSIKVNVDDMNNMASVQKLITDMGYQANSNAEWIESQKQQAGVMQAVLGGIGAVSLFVAAIGITNTMMMSIYERTKEIGIMKVLGCDMRNIRTQFLMEAGYIGLIGGIAGLALSYGISAIINAIAVNSNIGTASLSYIPAWLALLSIGFAVGVGMLAGLFPALRAMKLSPLAAIRNE